MEKDVRAEIADGSGDPLPEPLLAGDRGLARFDLNEQVEISPSEFISNPGAEDAHGRCLAEGLSHGRSNSRDLAGLKPHAHECTRGGRGADLESWGGAQATWERSGASRDDGS